ncbi:hypothetical protein ACFVRR_06330 [Gottfriedia sp. NPDC057948]|uniref:hypothetical protein n=1 Tax=Gottfriedia sp. NPDC057948 TaxID=3346287 RepID=UPI0036DF1A4A
MVKKKLAGIILLFSIITGCNKQDNKLDLTNLIQISTKKETKTVGIPIDYKAPSLKVALNALPFQVSLPKKLPFPSKPFKVSLIQDVMHDGKIVRIMFDSWSIETNNPQYISILVTNQKTSFSNELEQVKLKKGIKGSIQGSSIYFNKDGIFYNIDIMPKPIGQYNVKKSLISMANEVCEE